MSRLLFALFFALSGTAVAKPVAKTIVVLPVRPAAPTDEALARLLSGPLAAGVSAAHEGKVVSTDEVAAALEASALQQLMGCDSPKCSADLTRALAADQLVLSVAGTLGDQVVVSLALIDAKRARTIARSSAAFARSSDLARGMAGPAQLLLHPDSLATGDVLLGALRTGVLIDDESKLGETRRCVGDVVRGAGGSVVDERTAARVRTRADGKTLGDLDPLDYVDAKDMDTLVLGAVELSHEDGPATRRGTTSGKVNGDLALRLVRIDTGEELLALNERATQPFVGGATKAAERKVRDDLCRRLTTAIKAQLEASVARGQRLPVEVKGALTPSRAEELTKVLLALPGKVVARARVRTVSPTGAVIDVWTRGADGYAVALAWHKTTPTLVLAPEPGRVAATLAD